MYTFKENKCSLIFDLKIRKNGRKQQKKSNWAAVPTPNTDSEARYRGRVRPAGCPALKRTIVQSEAEPAELCAAGCPEAKRTIAEICDFFSAWCNFYQGSESEQLFAFTPSWWEKRTIIRLTPGRKLIEKRTKKTRARSSGVFRTIPLSM
jgi:hypothetical protein